MDDETKGRLPDEDELTRVTPPAGDGPTQVPPPDEDRTRVMPPADEGRTQVMPGEDTDATRVLPAGGGTPPPRPPQPTLVMGRGYQPPERGGVPWWVWLLVVLAIIAAAAAVWFFLLRPSSSDGTATTDGQQFVGTWAPQDGSGGGLVIKQSSEEFKVTQYDAQLQPAGSTSATLNGDQLELSVKASAVGLTDVTGTIDGVITHDATSDTLTLQFQAGSLQLKPIVYVRADVLQPGGAVVTPTPTTSPSPTTSPTTSPTASPSPTGSPTADQQAQANIAKLQVGIVAWAADNNNLYPPPQDVVDGGGLSQYVDPWPTNPYTSQTMTPGTSPGSYVYEQLAGGQGYKLTGYLSNGLTYTVP